MRIDLGLTVSFASILWVLLEGECTRRNGMLTVRQMTQKHPQHSRGLPFIWHFGMWSDLFIITPVFGIIVAFYAEQWSSGEISLLLTVGIALSGVLHWFYSTFPFPDSLVWKGEMSLAGWLHLIYMGLAFGIIGLLFFCTEHLSAMFLVMVSGLLVVHVVIANHIVLGWLNYKYRYPWCHDFIRNRDPWISIIASCAILAGLTWWATLPRFVS